MLVLIQHIRVISRREFLAGSAGLAALSVLGWPQSGAAQPSDGWNAGQLAHLIPLASHERILIEASFKALLTGTPRLTVNEGRRGYADGSTRTLLAIRCALTATDDESMSLWCCACRVANPIDSFRD